MVCFLSQQYIVNRLARRLLIPGGWYSSSCLYFRVTKRPGKLYLAAYNPLSMFILSNTTFHFNITLSKTHSMLIEGFIYLIKKSEWVSEWVSERASERAGERAGERASERVSDWLDTYIKVEQLFICVVQKTISTNQQYEWFIGHRQYFQCLTRLHLAYSIVDILGSTDAVTSLSIVLLRVGYKFRE